MKLFVSKFAVVIGYLTFPGEYVMGMYSSKPKCLSVFSWTDPISVFYED